MHEVWRRRLAVANAAVIVVALLSVGQISYEQRAAGGPAGLSESSAPGLGSPRATAAALPATATPSAGDTGSPSTPAEPTSASPVGASQRAVAGVPVPAESASTLGAAATGPSTSTKTAPAGRTKVKTRSTATPGTSAGATASASASPKEPVPDYGLITQGVTDKSVLIGVDYNKSGCGGAGALESQFSQAAVGDPEKSMTAYVDYINDTGGIGGRKLSYVSEDDGGENCPEQHAAAVTSLVDDDKVFMDIAGLHQVSDLLAQRHLPFDGGEDSLKDEDAQGYGQFQLLQDADDDFANWASFGKNYIASDKNTPCFIWPNEDDFPELDTLLKSKMAAQGLAFKDDISYQDDASTAAQQASTYAVKMSADGCKQVWALANNALGLVFFTAAASTQGWYPTWTWTSRTAGVDTSLFGSLMAQDEWKNSIGLSSRVKSGASKFQGDCAAIYKHYYPGDGESGSANAQLYCPAVLLSAEAMRRAIDKTGVLTGNSLMVGVNAIKGDFFFDATVPLTFNITTTGQSDFTAFDEETVAQWSQSAGDMVFPEFPIYWKLMGPNKSGGIDITSQLTKTYTYSDPKEYSYAIPTS